MNPVLTGAQTHTNIIQETNQVKYKLKTSDKCVKVWDLLLIQSVGPVAAKLRKTESEIYEGSGQS